MANYDENTNDIPFCVGLPAIPNRPDDSMATPTSLLPIPPPLSGPSPDSPDGCVFGKEPRKSAPEFEAGLPAVAVVVLSAAVAVVILIAERASRTERKCF